MRENTFSIQQKVSQAVMENMRARSAKWAVVDTAQAVEATWR